MDQQQFHNALRVLHSIDSVEIDNPEWWEEFAADPVAFFIRCDDERAETIWHAMEKRMERRR